MAFLENLTPFFTDFAVSCSWSPNNGDSTRVANVHFGSPSEVVGFELEMKAKVYQMLYVGSAFPGLDRGEVVTIQSKDYYVNETQEIADGLIVRAYLSALNTV